MASRISTRRKRKQHLDWASGLPIDLLELVVKKLPLIDCLSFNRVCKSWRSVTINVFEGPSHGIPLLVKPGQSEKRLRICLNVLDKKTKYRNCSTFDIPMPEESIGSYIWGSYRDWLILGKLHNEDYLHITLLNPFSGEKVVLPKTYAYKYHMVVLSSVPSDPRCIYMLVGMDPIVAFWTRSGGHEEWLSCSFQEWRVVPWGEGRSVSDTLYHDGHFYVIRDNYEIVVIDEINIIDTVLDCSRPKGACIKIATRYLELKKPLFSEEPSASGKINRTYIVESSGDILLVSRMFYDEGPKKYQTYAFETFRLDISGKAWIKLESLKNNKMIILGRSSSRSFDAKEELGDDALANYIYFSNNGPLAWHNEWGKLGEVIHELIVYGKGGDRQQDDWGVFHLEEGNNKTTGNTTSENNSNWPRVFDAHPKHWAGIWLTAPMWWCLRQHGGNYDVKRVRRATPLPRGSIRLKN